MPQPMSLQPLLRQPYSRDTYRTILEDILPSGTLKLLQTPQAIIAKCDDVTSTEQIGSIELPDGNTIALLEVHVADQVKLARNRVALRNFVARFIDEATTTAVLAVFHQAGKPDWRLTYACKRSQLDEDTLEITSTQTAPRRYTFLLGQHEPCRTAAGRLAELREKGEHLTLEELEKAFSVERLNKDFFKDYKKHYEAFVAHLLSPENAKTTRSAFGIATHKEKAAQDKADKPVRDFVKRLLGRLVFLHFLQKKGWMGCKAGSKAWTGGDSDFLATYFKTASAKNDAHHFHSRWLIPLFFDALNNADRAGDLFPPTGTRIPYLNGGLFETDPASLHALDFPAALFENLLNFFGEYNFTIDENDPEDHEVGIDPEMLGHIFENLLEDNKDKGAFYTPKAIVSYMARQSLLHYLQTHLGEDPELAVLLNEKDFTRLEKNGFVHQHAKRIAELLDAVTICDPAIGSGAFSIGLLQEILWTQLTLDLTLNTPDERAKLKRRIIQNSIHGVDLDPGAVEIARLRFWLALVVDEEQPRPLPNLDYKIHRADSLIEYIRGEPVHLGKVSAEDKRTHQAIQNLIAAKAALFTAQKLPEKRAARFALYRALAEVAIAEFTWLRNEMGLIAGDVERAAQLDSGLKEFSHRLTLIDNATKLKAEHQDRRLEDLREWFDDDQKPTFLWQLHFGEVFANGGFDIVIANPPYVQITPERFSSIDINRLKLVHNFSYKTDLYELFLAHAPKLLNPNGVACYIAPIAWLLLENSGNLRRNLLTNHGISLVRIWGENVFSNAVVSTQTAFIHRDKPTHSIQIVPVDAEPFSLSTQHIKSHPHCNIDFRQTPIIGTITKKMQDRSQRVEAICEVSQGITPYDKYRGHSQDLIRNRGYHSKSKDNKTFGHWLNGKDVSRYKVQWSGEWLSYGDWLGAPREEKFFTGPKLLCREVPGPGKRIQAAFHNGVVYCGHAISPLIARASANIDIKFVLAILNSTPLSWFASKCSPNFSKDVFPKLNPSDIKDLPIPPASAADKARLSQLAEACAVAAQRGDDETLAVHEAEIDDIVYRLFGLTEEEIALIEAALAPTRGAAPARKRVRTKPAAPVGDTTTYEAPEAATETRVQETPPTPQLAPAPAWLPGELFNVEGELPAAKKARAAPEAARRETPKSIPKQDSRPADDTERADVLAVIREVFSSGGERDRETALREIAQALGYERLGSRIREVLNTDIRTAVRRGILQNQNTRLSLLCRSIEDYERDFLKELFLAAISQNGRVWLERQEAIRLFARWLGFRRTGRLIDESARSLIKGLLRDGSLEKDGQDWIRRI